MDKQLPLRTRLAVIVASGASLAMVAVAGPGPTAAASALASASVRVTATVEAPVWSHNPALPDGPTHWAGLTPDWAACGGDGDQSPIVINDGRRVALPPLQVDYPRVPLIVENTGHVVEVPQPADAVGTLRFGTAVYRLTQWHVHAPSEHVVNGHRADLEIHLVHQDAQGSTAVLAIFADIARPGPGADGRGGTAGLLRRTLRAAPETAGEETDTGTKASPVTLLPSDARRSGRPGAVVGSYLTYGGSLTTPPCTTGVRWFVLPTLVRVDAGTVDRLHELVAGFPGYGGYPDNNRPVQPIGTRTVQRRAG
ncbi:carbonic anhydrase family protein [Actinoplanes sp. CA-030573]|uniref:carbonic anhydrase family protein n=1 Tax=Actinoplanes sp. CA-030573 TaxID=3239898 RepID=UPI003D8BA495